MAIPSRRMVLSGLVGGGLAVGAGTLPGAMRNLLIRTRDTVTVDERGASLTGLRAAFREVRASGGTVRLAARTIRISIAELIADGPLALPGSTRLEGEGASITLVGAAVSPPLFAARNMSSIVLRNLAAAGNGRAIADTRSGTFALFEMNAAATSGMEDIVIENVALSRFAGERWVQFLQRAPERAMTGLRIDDLRAEAGASIAPAAIGVSAAALWIHGAGGEIRDVSVRRLTIRGAGIKQGCALFHKVRDATVSAALIADVGARGAVDDAGAYAIMAYANPGEMSGITITAPVIRRPRSVGIYLRGARQVRVLDAAIDGQTDRVATDLPKGAIALNGCSGVVISGGRLTGNVVDLSVADGGVNALDLHVDGLRTSGSRTSALFAISPGRGAVTGVRFTGCDLSAGDRVLQVLNEQVRGRHYNDVELRGGSFRSATAGNVIELTQIPTAATGYRIEDVTIAAGHVAVMATGLQGTLVLRQVTIEGLAKMEYGIVADDCPRLDWAGLTFRGTPPRVAYAARALRRRSGGVIRGLNLPTGGGGAAPGSLRPTS